jgi:hypothetical protein
MKEKAIDNELAELTHVMWPGSFFLTASFSEALYMEQVRELSAR